MPFLCILPDQPMRLLFWIITAAAAATPPAGAAIDFTKDLAPVLEQKCLSCHNPNVSKGDLSMASLAEMLDYDDEMIVKGEHKKSLLHQVIVTSPGSKGPDMPKKGTPLTKEEIQLVADWIDSGAIWPEGLVLREASKAGQSWWAYQPLKKVDSTEEQSIDDFIDSKLKEKNLSMNPPADPRTFIRRATYDLTGLPPTQEEVDQFTKEYQSPGKEDDAVNKLIDRLLASPSYGERWGRHWLDVVRFGESNGFERNVIINSAWPFRDYVIESINADKPFDQFFREHLAGDVIDRDDPKTAVGSAFLVTGPYDNVGNQDAKAAAQIRANTLDEMIRATSEAFLGLTIGCARCHDHKFDPISSEDYYSLYATFSGVKHGEAPLETKAERDARAQTLAPLNTRKASLIKERDTLAGQSLPPEKLAAEQKRLQVEIQKVDQAIKAVPQPHRVWIGSRNNTKGPFHIFFGGDPQKKGPAVNPASLSILNKVAPSYQLDANGQEAERRMKLAEWLTDSRNPLPPRVLANRIWQHHFGTGIVDTPNDFGFMGGKPSHPELLDFLAAALLENGWKLKPMHRLVMTSRAYRQSSQWSESAARIDGESRLLWRFPPRRLSGEEIRDTILHVAGKLDLKRGGPGFRLYEYQQDNVATYVPLDKHGPETYRRAVYHQNARASVIDLMSDFDQPDCAFSTPRRTNTTTALQALTMLNHSFTVDMAEALSLKVESAGPETTARVKQLFSLAYQRPPKEDELAQAKLLADSHGLRALARALLNSSELIHLD